jgi:hypothetical protein
MSMFSRTLNNWVQLVLLSLTQEHRNISRINLLWIFIAQGKQEVDFVIEFIVKHLSYVQDFGGKTWGKETT